MFGSRAMFGRAARLMPALLAVVIAATPCAAQRPAIGVAVPAAGVQAETGAAIRAGVALAVFDWVAADPTVGAIAIKVEDDGCSSAGAADAAARLRARSVAIVIGHPCPAAAVAAAKIYAAAGITFIAPATGHPRLSDERAGPTIFRLGGRSDANGSVAAAFLAQRYRGQRVAVISDRSAYGQSVAEAARKALASGGMTDVITGHVKPAQKDYGALVSGFKAASVKAIVFGGFPTEAFVLVGGLRSEGIDAPILLGDVGAEAAALAAGREAAQGLLVIMTPDPMAFGAAARSVLKRLEARGEQATLPALQAYAAVEVWRVATETLKAEGGGAAPAGPSLAAAIGTGTFATAVGPITFDQKGDARIPSHAVYRWRGSHFEQVWMPSN
jgi:branched-chain amino acid transport system substrate-binding protein